MDRLIAMRMFVEIVDRGSLTAAAEALGRSQPAVVRALAGLEAHLGTVLLRRTTRRMSLTPEGRDYLARCRRILADVDDAERAVGQDNAEPRGDLRVTAPVQFGQIHLGPILADFLKRYEQVRLDLLLVDRVVDLIEEGIDLALRIGHLADSSMVAVRIGEVRPIVCASPRLLERSGIPTHPGELSDLPCIRQQNLSRPEATWSFLENGRSITVPINGRFGCNQIAAARTACIAGFGFGQFLSYQVTQEVSEGRLHIVLEEFEPKPWPVSLVYPGSRLVTARLRVLIDWLTDSLQRRRLD
jgi:DNA-binding transcriptional LysR family regulator